MSGSAGSVTPAAARKPVRALFDTNVVLDWALNRKPWSDEAQPLWDARDTGSVVSYLPASVLTDIYYIARRQAGIPAALGASSNGESQRRDT